MPVKRWMILLSFFSVAVQAQAVKAPARRIVTLGSEQPFMQGRNVAMAGPWSRWVDPSIKDFSNSIRIDTGSWPRDTFIQWRFPAKVASTGVYGYNYLAFGQYWDLKPPVTVPPKSFRAIKTLKFHTAIERAGDASGFNILAEYFVTKKPGDIGSRTAEVGWLLHMPDLSAKYFRMGKQVGSFRDSAGRDWIVASHRDGAAGHYIMIAPRSGDADLSAPIDALAAMRWLAARGEIGLDGYFNGMAVGIEPLKGSGSATIRRFDVFYN